MKILLKIGKGILMAPLVILLGIGLTTLVAIILSIVLLFHIINFPIRAVRYWRVTRKLGKLSNRIVVIYSATGKWKSYIDHYKATHPRSGAVFIDVAGPDMASSTKELITVTSFVNREFNQVSVGDAAFIAKFGRVPLWGTKTKVLGKDRSLAQTIKEYSD